jgi:hypothetical protein
MASPARRSAGPPSRFLVAPEQALRPEREHHHERRVEHGHRPGRVPDVHDGLGCQHEHRGRERAADATEAAKDDHREQPRDKVVAAVRVDAAAGRAEHHAARRGDRDADPERQRGDAVHVDPDQPGRRLVLHGGADAAAELGAVEQPVQREHQRDRHGEAVQVDVGQVETEDVDARGHVRGVQRDVVGPEHLVQDALDDDRHRVAGQQRHRGPLAAAQRADERPLDDHPDDEHRGHRQQQAEEQVEVQVHGQRVAEVGAQDHHDALGDVDDVEHAEDQRQPDGHQRVDAAAEHAVDHGVQDLGCHRPPPRRAVPCT